MSPRWHEIHWPEANAIASAVLLSFFVVLYIAVNLC